MTGANGSGKTTLVRLMNGLLRPQSGRVIVDGLDTGRVDVRKLAAHVGLVFQHPGHQLFAATVREELAFGPRNLGVAPAAVEERVAAAAGMLGIEGLLDRHPYRLGSAQRKLVALASVLTMRTPVLILDEPTTGQDHRTVQTLVRLIADLRAGGRTVSVVAHNTAFLAETVDRLVVMDAGRIVADGTPRAVFADGALARRVGLSPPQVTELSLRLDRSPHAAPWPALTVDELAAAWGEPPDRQVPPDARGAER